MKVFFLMNDELAEILGIRIRGQTKVVSTTACVYYRTPDQKNADKSFT